jgi:hypothetical protein
MRVEMPNAMLDAIITLQPHNTTRRQRLGRRRHGDFI